MAIQTNDLYNALNKGVINDYHKYVANKLVVNKIPLDSVFFISLPGFIVFTSEMDKAIMNKPASYYVDFITRKVIFEKCKIEKKFTSFYQKEMKKEDKISSITRSVCTYKLNWKKTLYGEEFDCMKALKEFIESKSHLAIFLLVNPSFFEDIKKDGLIRVATYDATQI